MSNQESDRRLVTIRDAAERVDVNPRTIRRWINAGRLTGYRVGPRLIKVDLNDLEAVVRIITPTEGSAV